MNEVQNVMNYEMKRGLNSEKIYTMDKTLFHIKKESKCQIDQRLVSVVASIFISVILEIPPSEWLTLFTIPLELFVFCLRLGHVHKIIFG